MLSILITLVSITLPFAFGSEDRLFFSARSGRSILLRNQGTQVDPWQVWAADHRTLMPIRVTGYAWGQSSLEVVELGLETGERLTYFPNESPRLLLQSPELLALMTIQALSEVTGNFKGIKHVREMVRERALAQGEHFSYVALRPGQLERHFRILEPQPQQMTFVRLIECHAFLTERGGPQPSNEPFDRGL